MLRASRLIRDRRAAFTAPADVVSPSRTELAEASSDAIDAIGWNDLEFWTAYLAAGTPAAGRG
jgi:hypothetical protein